MLVREYTLRFLTPAFLGNAEQGAEWRTPPLKALLRQWWRVAYAAKQGFDVDVAAIRREEGRLFGHAWLEDDVFERDGKQVKTAARKSAVRIRLGRWNEGSLKRGHWPTFGRLSHPEVRQAVASDLYLGYGPVTLPRGATNSTLKANAAIQVGESTTFSLAVPETDAPLIEHALWLMDRYAALGGRSRNGWGSFSLAPIGEGPALIGKPPLRDWKTALALDWPHAIGSDGDARPLIWQTAPHDDWKALMKTLAVVKIGLRTQFKFASGKDAPAPEARHWLSYPVTNHSVKNWGGNARLPNSLRFKIRGTADNQLVGAIFHVPCLPPAAFKPDNRAIEGTWQRVHGFLDAPENNLTRIAE